MARDPCVSAFMVKQHAYRTSGCSMIGPHARRGSLRGALPCVRCRAYSIAFWVAASQMATPCIPTARRALFHHRETCRARPLVFLADQPANGAFLRAEPPVAVDHRAGGRAVDAEACAPANGRRGPLRSLSAPVRADEEFRHKKQRLCRACRPVHPAGGRRTRWMMFSLASCSPPG